MATYMLLCQWVIILLEGKPHICLPSEPHNYIKFTLQNSSTKLFYEGDEGEPAHAVEESSREASPQSVSVAAVLHNIVRNDLLTELTTKYQDFLQSISTKAGSVVNYTELYIEKENTSRLVKPVAMDQISILLFEIPVPSILKNRINEIVHEHRKLSISMNWKPKPVFVGVGADFRPRKLCFVEDDNYPYLNAYVLFEYVFNLSITTDVKEKEIIITNYSSKDKDDEDLFVGSVAAKELTGALRFKGQEVF